MNRLFKKPTLFLLTEIVLVLLSTCNSKNLLTNVSLENVVISSQMVLVTNRACDARHCDLEPLLV